MICRFKHSLIQRHLRNFTGKGKLLKSGFSAVIVAEFFLVATFAGASVCFRMEAVIRRLA